MVYVIFNGRGDIADMVDLNAAARQRRYLQLTINIITTREAWSQVKDVAIVAFQLVAFTAKHPDKIRRPVQHNPIRPTTDQPILREHPHLYLKRREFQLAIGLTIQEASPNRAPFYGRDFSKRQRN
jgi:hypothetical protein